MSSSSQSRQNGESGIALVLCLLAMLVLMSIGSALVLTSSVEAVVAGNYRATLENSDAAVVALERAIADLPLAASWSPLLAGSQVSGFVDGTPSGPRTLADGSTINLTSMVNLANCSRVTTCTAAQMDTTTIERPWGTNNPRWQPFAFGALSQMLPPGEFEPDQYLVVLIADDPLENDGDPVVDGGGVANPGRGMVLLRAEAFGPRGAHHAVEAAVIQAEVAPRIVSWRDLARLDHP